MLEISSNVTHVTGNQANSHICYVFVILTETGLKVTEINGFFQSKLGNGS